MWNTLHPGQVTFYKKHYVQVYMSSTQSYTKTVRNTVIHCWSHVWFLCCICVGQAYTGKVHIVLQDMGVHYVPDMTL